ncbi:hypothetical protein EC991_009890 [Linnemannia zychae]|nr:hypothetical protein EC991_009890 [Linnemannia zychae]
MDNTHSSISSSNTTILHLPLRLSKYISNSSYNHSIPLGSGVLDTFQDRTAMALMQRYLTNPDDPESEADIQMQIMISQAAVDSKGFEVLVPQSVESIKRHHATLSSRIAALTARLSLESKIREAAQSLLKLHADNKKLARQASDHLEAANRKVDQVATELWKLTQLAADLQRTLLQHTSGVLALGVVRLEDQGRRERDVHALQLHEARVGKDVEEQFEAMSRTIMSLESDTLEAQSLLEDKDRTIDRLMKQLDHQRELYVRLDEQQQKMMVLSRSQQKNLDLLGGSRMNDAKTAAELEAFLAKVAGRLQGILQQQQQQQQQYRHQKQISTGTSARKVVTIDSERHQRQEEEEEDRNRSAQTWPSDLTLLSNGSASTQRSSTKMGPGREDSMSSSTRDGNSNLSTTVVSDRTATSSQESTIANNNNDDAAVITQHVSKERIFSTLDALDHFMTEAQQKSQILEEELGLLRRQSVALSESRNNSIKIKNFSSVRGQAAEDTIRSALEKSLKDALLEKEIARQELENERQRWQDDQNHRISALEESLVAVEDSDKLATGDTSSEVGTDGARSSQQDEETIRTLRQQLQEAIDEIDTLSQQQQSSLKSMRQLFDLIPDSRRKSHLQLFAAHQQQQRNGSTGGSESGRASPAGSVLSVSSVNAAVGFSMETLIARVRELVMRSQQLEQQQQQQDPSETNHPKAARSRQTSHQGSTLLPPNQDDLHHPQQNQDSTWISNSELERLQANAGMIQLLEKEIELLKQHTDMLLDENARLAEMAAATATSAPASRNTADLRAMISPPSKDDALDELHEIIRVKDTLLRERDEIVEQQEKALLQVRSELTLAVQANEEKKQQMSGGDEVSSSSSSSPPPLSSFDVVALEDFRVQCDKLEEQNGEMRMIIAALEAAHGGPGSGAQLLSTLQSTATNTPSSPTATGSWLTSRLGSAGSLSFGSLTQKLAPTPLPALEPTSSNSSNINTPIPSSVDAFSNSSSSHSPSSSSLQQPIGGGGGSHAAITSATAALRKEFRRVMTELREEKEKAVRKEVEERRRLERTVRQLRRELQAIQQ